MKKTPLKRTGGPKRYTEMKRANSKRLAKRRAEEFGDKAAWIRTLPCAVPGCTRRDIDPDHVKTRGAGGKSDVLVPLCAFHHRRKHWMGRWTFQDRYSVDLEALAAKLEAEWQSLAT